jgi:large subunit ribosomal protein L14
MIQLRTRLNVADNTGAKILMCFHIMIGSKRNFGQLGDIIVGVVKEAEPRRIVKKHEVVRALIIRQRSPYRRQDGSYIRFDDNAVVLLNNLNEIRGTRIFGPVARELRDNYMKIVSLAPEVL